MAADIAEQTGEVSDKRIKQIGQSLIESFFEQIELEPVAEKPAKNKSALKNQGKSAVKSKGSEMDSLIREKAEELVPVFNLCMAFDQGEKLSEIVAAMATDIAEQTGDVSDELVMQIGQSLIEICAEISSSESDDEGQDTEAEEVLPPVFQAVHEGDAQAIKEIVARDGKDVLEQTIGPVTPLVMAISAENEELVGFLVESGANVNHAPDSPQGQTSPLTAACQGGHDNIALYLLDHGANVNQPVWSAFETEDGDSIRIENLTPLFTAAQAGAFGICKALLEKGADIDPMTGHGFTPLMVAIKHHHNELAEYLMEKGAKVDFPPPGNLPVDKWACLNPLLAAITNDNDAMVRLLLEKAVRLDVVDNGKGGTPVKLATMQGNLEIVNMLLARGCAADVPDQDGWTAMHNAAADGRADIVEALLAHGANPDTPTTNEELVERGRTPLMDAAFNGYEGVVSLLLKAGADPNRTSAAGSTPLGSSLVRGKIGAARILLEAGSDPCRPDAEGDQPLVNAIRHLMIARAQSDEVESDTELDELENLAGELINRGASLNTIESQSGLSMLQMAALTSDTLGLVLLDHGADPNGADDTDRAGLSGMVPSAFHLACEKKRLGMFKRLLGMDLDPLMKGPRGNSVLAVAAGSGFIEGIELLLDHPAVQAAPVGEWLAAYRLAVRNGQRGIALRLIEPINERSDQQDHQDSDGYTPLMHAVAEGNLEKLNALLEAGADPDRLDLFAESALSFAMEKAIKQSDKGKKRRGRASAAAGNVYLAMVTSLVNQGAESIEDEGVDPDELAFKAAAAGALGTLLSILGDETPELPALLAIEDEDGNTLLNLAAANGHAGMVRILPLMGADVDHRNYEGDSAYQVARSRGFHSICGTLAEYSAEDAASADGTIHWSLIPASESRRSGPGKDEGE
jgi:ankyrin repeat protein